MSVATLGDCLEAGACHTTYTYTYANDNPVSGSDPTGLLNYDGGDGGGGYTDDDVDRLYPVAGANDNPNPHPNGNDDNDGGTNHSKKKHGFGGWIKKRVNDVTDKVDEAHDWAKDHASVVGAGVALGVGIVAGVAFCAGTAGVGCVIIAGAIAGAASAGAGYGTSLSVSRKLVRHVM